MNEAVKDLVKYYEDSEVKNAYEVTLKMLMVAVGQRNAETLYCKC